MKTGIRITKSGFDALNPPTEFTKKNYIVIDDANTPKVIYKGFETSSPYTHDLGYVPIVFAFTVDSTTNPTYFSAQTSVSADTTKVYFNGPAYIVILGGLRQ